MSKNNYFLNNKKTKIVLAKSTTALTCLFGLWIVSNIPAQASTTTTGTMAVSTTVSATCTVSAGNMTFAAYTGSLITATSAISVNCTNGTTYTVSFNDTPDSTPAYYLVRSGGSSATASDRIEVTFTNGSSTMTSAAATITGTGTGSSAAAGTITGTLAGSQTGKTAGSFSKTMTLNLVY